MKTKNLFLYLFLISSVFANIALSAEIFKNSKEAPDEELLSNYGKRYPYISKNIFTEQENDIFINFTPLRQSLKEYVSEQNLRIGIYFEYLPSGTSIGINEKESFYQASLIKVPMAMAILKKVSEGDLETDEKISIKPEHLDKKFGRLWEKGVGYTLTIDETISIMLKKSDNTAYRMLFSIYPEYLDNIFDFLDIPKDTQEDEPIVTPKNYSSIFKSLYLSSYLEPEYSNKILDILTDTDFNDRISSPIPQNIKVAHKIGIIKEKNVYTDCGIIYLPHRPYTLCVMVEGTKEDALRVLPEISEIIFRFISKR